MSQSTPQNDQPNLVEDTAVAINEALSIPSPPIQQRPSNDWEYTDVYQNITAALYSLPAYFKTDLVITGVLATDLFTFNTSLGATIETQVVAALNSMRSTWDPEQKYSLYSFVRQSQRFPDVILRATSPNVEPYIIMGIELKGWYALAKEKEPSFRYRITPACCALADLLVVFPWTLSGVISGSPQLLQPYITSARYASEYRNYWWEYIKESGDRNKIRLSNVNHFYPQKSELSSDVPEYDDGSNFGRFARTSIMDEYMGRLFQEELSGIPLSAWQKFLSAFSEEKTAAQIDRAVTQAIRETQRSRQPISENIEAVKALLIRISALLE